MKRKLWICFAAALATAAVLAPRPARGDSAGKALEACLPQGSICINLPPPTEQCCGSNFCKPESPNGRGGVCTPF